MADASTKLQANDSNKYTEAQGGGGFSSFTGGNVDFDNAKEEAHQKAGSSGDKDLFGSILGALGQKQNKLADEDLDEEGGHPSLVYMEGDTDRV